MTTVEYNLQGIDIVELNIETKGTSFADFTTKDVVLNSQFDYIFGVTSLDVDCSNLPIFPPSTNETLITIVKRTIAPAQAPGGLANADHTPTFSVTPAGKRYFDTSSFLENLSTFANTFAEAQDNAGLVGAAHGGADIAPDFLSDNNLVYLKIGIDTSCRIKIKGVSQFWDNFAIKFSDFAVKIFQIEDIIQRIGNSNFLSVTLAAGNYVANGLVAANGNVQAGGNLRDSVVTGTRSMLKFLDARLYMEVHTHLPISRNLKIVNGEEKTDISIARVPFINDATATIFCQNNVIAEDLEFTTRTYCGKVSFIKKTDPITRWTTLTTSYEQRIFRFQLYCVYNVFAAGVFSQQIKKVVFDADGYWNMGLRFVNMIK
jgi:hypothetical protein